MRTLILGGTGMLGHKLHEVLSQEHAVVSTSRTAPTTLPVDARPFFREGRVVEGVDAADLEGLGKLIADVEPDAVVNCIGVVKQRDDAHDAATSIAVNALFPHHLADICRSRGARLIHFSTDCVFSGSKGDYTEEDPSDATDLYGRTKSLGELAGDGVVTIRSSIIGRELDHFQSLLEWFLRQEGEVGGYTRAIFTGITTAQMASLVGLLLTEHHDLSGLYQVASKKISKFELLALIRERFGLEERIHLVPDESYVCDRSLRGDRFAAATGILIPPWQEMIDRLVDEAERYGGV